MAGCQIDITMFGEKNSNQPLLAEIEDLRARLAAAEAALRETKEEKEFLSGIVERSSQPFAIGYLDGRIGMVNGAFERLTGYTAQELTSMNWSDTLTPPEWHEHERESLEALHRNLQPVRYEKEFLRKDGTRVPIELFVDLSTGAEGRPVCYYSFVSDMTEQKRAAQSLRKIESRFHSKSLNSQLEARVAARTSSLQAAVEQLDAEIIKRHLLVREILNVNEREQYKFGQDLHEGLGQELAGMAFIGDGLAKRLQNEAHPASQVAGDLAAYIRGTIDSARLLAKGLYPVELDRFGLLIALEDLAHRTAEGNGIICKLKQIGKFPKLDKFAEIHIYRIVQECLDNAIKHGAARSIFIETQALAGVCCFAVADDGIGFENSGNHSGVGLNIMRYRARMIGGEISMEHPAQGGCRIKFQIPRDPQFRPEIQSEN